MLKSFSAHPGKYSTSIVQQAIENRNAKQEMKKAVDLAKKIYKDPESNWMSHLEDINLHKVFRPVYHHNFTIEIQNKNCSCLSSWHMTTIRHGGTRKYR